MGPARTLSLRLLPGPARGSRRWTADAREDIYPGARLRPGKRPDPAPRNWLPVLCRLFPYLVDRARLLTTTFATAAAAATFAADPPPPPSPPRAVLCISFLSFPLFASLCSHSTIRRATSNPPLLQQCRRRAPAPATHVRRAETAPPARLARREGCTATTRPTRCVVCWGGPGTDRACAPGQCQCRRGAPAPADRPPPRPGTPMCAPCVPRVRTPRPKNTMSSRGIGKCEAMNVGCGWNVELPPPAPGPVPPHAPLRRPPSRPLICGSDCCSHYTLTCTSVEADDDCMPCPRRCGGRGAGAACGWVFQRSLHRVLRGHREHLRCTRGSAARHSALPDHPAPSEI